MSKVQSTEGMFEGAKRFNQDLSNWDVSKVSTMDEMFWGASSFRGSTGWWLFKKDLNDWDVSKVTDMSATFAVGDEYVGTGQLREIIGLENWDVSNVIDMTCLFYGAGNMTTYNISVSNNVCPHQRNALH